MAMPNSRSRPRTVLMRAVRAASQAERSRCKAERACWLSDLIGTGWICSLRWASSSPLASVRSVLLPVT